MPVLDPDLATRIADGIAGLLARDAPGKLPQAEDRAAAEFAATLRRRDLREILYLPDLAAPPRWPETLYRDGDPNKERVFIRVATEREKVEYACAVFHGSLVHWEHAVATLDGTVTFAPMTPDAHWRMKLEVPEARLREMGLTLVPPAALQLRFFDDATLAQLLDPRADRLAGASRTIAHMAESLHKTRGIRSPAHAYQRVLDLLRLGYDPATLAVALEGRTPQSMVELHAWLEEKNPPFAWIWTRGEES